MLAHKFKIADKDRILYILKKGLYARGRLLHIKFLRSRDIKTCRFSLIVTKRISRKATQRALVRRRVYEAIRRNWSQMPKTCYDIVALPSQRIVQAKYSDIERDLLLTIKKLK